MDRDATYHPYPPEGEVAPPPELPLDHTPARRPLSEVADRTDREDGVRIDYGKAVFEDGYLHGRELVDVFAPVVKIPAQRGKYVAVGRLENGKRLFRWVSDDEAAWEKRVSQR